jgi:hypothetical protein
MSEVRVFPAGGYRYIPAVFQYSGGAAPEPGFEIERVRLMKPLPLGAGFAAIEAHLSAIGRPPTALAQCELRSPEPLSDQGFTDFNREYVVTLERWGLYKEGVNPVARTNVCPIYGKPAAPSVYAFSYTVPARDAKRGTFVLSGAGEAKPGSAPYRDRIVRFGDTSPEGLREKVAAVIAETERRLLALGFGWGDAFTTQAFTAQDIGHLVGELLGKRGAIAGGLVWHYARPPVIGLDYEMDARSAARELVL